MYIYIYMYISGVHTRREVYNRNLAKNKLMWEKL